MTVFKIVRTRGFIQVFDAMGKFLFSCDNERELREELSCYA